MKTIKIMAVIFLLSGITSFAQNLWKTEVPLNFTVQSNTKASSFVDENGIHIVYSRNGGIRYALASSEGGVIKYDKVIESEGSGTDFANVVANGNIVYAIYHKSNYIRVARSTNLGDSWNTSFSTWPLTNTACNKIVAYRDGNDIRITWSERRVGSYDSDVHYIKFYPAAQEWDEYKRVSENDQNGGENPDFAFTSEKVEVNYTSFYQPKNRERLSNGSWNNSENIPYVQLPLTNQVQGIKPHIVGNTLNVIYLNQWVGWSAAGVYIGHSYRNINSTQWTDNQTILTTDWVTSNIPYPHVTANTSDGKIHLVYWDKDNNRYSYRQLNGSTFSNHIAEIGLSSLSSSLNAVSNDMFLVRTDNPSTPGSIKLRHYDAAPLAPQNYAISVYQSGNNKYPKLTWSLNNEPDVRNNPSNAYKIERRTRNSRFEAWSAWSNIANLGGTVSTYIDYSINTAGGGDKEAEYRLTAIDIEDNQSPQQSVIIIYGMGGLDKISSIGNVIEYELNQNYPNPFNPSTKISYSIKENGFVSLKVFDMLGREIADLVNETKDAGEYTIEFSAKNLPSGIYIYSIRVNEFVQTGKMTLLK